MVGGRKGRNPPTLDRYFIPLQAALVAGGLQQYQITVLDYDMPKIMKMISDERIMARF